MLCDKSFGISFLKKIICVDFVHIVKSYTKKYSLSSSWLEEVMHKDFILYHESCAENIPF